MSEERIRIRSASGEELIAPREWTPAFIEVGLTRPEDWQQASVRLNGVELPLSLRRLGGSIRAVAEWPRSGPGGYRIHLTFAGASYHRMVAIRPSKMGEGDYSQL